MSEGKRESTETVALTLPDPPASSLVLVLTHFGPQASWLQGCACACSAIPCGLRDPSPLCCSVVYIPLTLRPSKLETHPESLLEDA